MKKQKYTLKITQDEQNLHLVALTWCDETVTGITLHRGTRTPEFAVLCDLFGITTEHDDYAKVNCAKTLAELLGYLRKRGGRGYARPLIGGSIVVDRFSTRKGEMTITGTVEFDPATVAARLFADTIAALEPLPCMGTHREGAHWGLGDWYPEIEAGITTALLAGTPFTTGWYGSKKETASACICGDGTTLNIEISVSNDFDTEGLGEASIPWTTDLEIIRKATYAAWDQAEQNQKDNEPVNMVVIGKPSADGKRGTWEETYIQDAGSSLDCPPGDNYHTWGWDQAGPDSGVYEGALSDEERAELEAAIESYGLPCTTSNGKWIAEYAA